MKDKVTKAIDYLMPQTLNYKYDSKIRVYLTIIFFSLLPIFGVYVAEITIKASQNYYWLNHLLFGVAGPWIFGFMALLYCYPHSFRLGVGITILGSLGNEFVFDVLDHGEKWNFSEQIIHTISDLLGIIVSCFIYKFSLKKHNKASQADTF